MKLARIVDGQPVAYSADQLRRDFPLVEFPRELTQRDLPAGVHIVVETPRPRNVVGVDLVYDGAAVFEVWTATDEAGVRAQIVGTIKAGAQAHILARLPAWKQQNLTARALELIEQKLASGLSEDEAAELEAARAQWAWVKRVRTMSNEAEAALPAMTRAELDTWTPPDYERAK